MNPTKRAARLVGSLYIAGTVAGILSVVFTHSALGSADSLKAVAANESGMLLGTLFMLIMGISLAMVPVIMYPILKRYHQTLALGYVVFRGALETFTYMVTAMSWLLLVVLSNEQATVGSSEHTGFQLLGKLLVEGSERIQPITTIVFSLGALMFYYVLYRFGLIPKWLSGWGLASGVLYLVTGVLGLFGETYTFLLMPLALQEMVMAIWLIGKGFNRSVTS